jgi:purine-cytosine permease-like protein
MWTGSSINIAYVVYGALLMGFGISVRTALVLIVVGNLSYLLVGVASLQGIQAGTTTFAISRAAFGTRGARLVSFINWVTQLGFEVEALILIVGASAVLSQIAGVRVGAGLKVTFIVAACAIQTVLPFFGHATMVRVLRALIGPFIAVFVLVALFALPHVNLDYRGVAGGWELDSAGLAFVVALSGLGWTECANDYSRYVSPTSSPRAVVGWVFVATALPEIVLMTMGALLFTFLSTSAVWNGTNPFEVLRHQSTFPSWAVVAVMVVAIVQMFSIDALVLYSSGVSLLATGVRIRRYQAVLLDGVLAGLLTVWATFQSSFSAYTKEFVGVIIVWIAPWLGVFLVDWWMRGRRYVAGDLERTDRGSRYFTGRFGVHRPGIIAFVGGLVSATVCFSKAPPPVNFPFHWMTPVSNAFGSFYCSGTAAAHCGPAGWFGGADFSAPVGIVVAGSLYYGLTRGGRWRGDVPDPDPAPAPATGL